MSYIIIGFMAGTLNAAFGIGGGMVLAPAFVRMGLSRHEAHACSVCVILPICILSTFLFVKEGFVRISDALIFSLYGLIGAFIGALFFKKINPNILRNIFALFSIWAGIRLILR
ncbi:MAG: sulfite exporter TauE/SafE family protein [Oscillospiraceae bacterium]|nr:sulfite exporter TauE/SafE family protein [Oscillospiraceae bacterium]